MDTGEVHITRKTAFGIAANKQEMKKDQDVALDHYVLSGRLALVPLLSMYADTPAQMALCGDEE
jgi:hypothetical protein